MIKMRLLVARTVPADDEVHLMPRSCTVSNLPATMNLKVRLRSSHKNQAVDWIIKTPRRPRNWNFVEASTMSMTFSNLVVISLFYWDLSWKLLLNYIVLFLVACFFFLLSPSSSSSTCVLSVVICLELNCSVYYDLYHEKLMMKVI